MNEFWDKISSNLLYCEKLNAVQEEENDWWFHLFDIQNPIILLNLQDWQKQNQINEVNEKSTLP